MRPASFGATGTWTDKGALKQWNDHGKNWMKGVCGDAGSAKRSEDLGSSGHFSNEIVMDYLHHRIDTPRAESLGDSCNFA